MGYSVAISAFFMMEYILEKNLDCFHQFLWLQQNDFYDYERLHSIEVRLHIFLIKVKVIKFMECIFHFKENSFPNLKFKIFQTASCTKLGFTSFPSYA